MNLSATDFAALAVVIDSAVTLFVGRKLIHTAERETAKAAETVTPVIQEHLSQAINTLLPLAIQMLKKDKEEEKHVSSGSIVAIDKRSTDKTQSG